jgi:hypothetical protein
MSSDKLNHQFANNFFFDNSVNEVAYYLSVYKTNYCVWDFRYSVVANMKGLINSKMQLFLFKIISI